MSKLVQAEIAVIEGLLGRMECDVLRDMGAGRLQLVDESFNGPGGPSNDRGTESIGNGLRSVDSAPSERHNVALHAIQRARERLALQQINECETCGGEIGYIRLLVLPVAVRCVECQERFEAAQAH